MPDLKDAIASEQAAEEDRDPRLVAIEALAAELHSDGVDFRVEGGKLGSARPDRDRETTVDLGSEHIRLGIVSDTHGGSRYEQLTALRSFYAYADKRKVDAYIHGGDVTQGSDRMHRGMELEVHAHGADAQVDYVVETFPVSKRAKTYAIAGNHDASFRNEGGVNVVRRIAAQRDDLEYIGEDAAYLTLGGLRVYVIHPMGGGAYAKSHRGQKISESIPEDRGVRLLLIGHYHNEATFRWQGVRVLQLPCFQSQYAYLARKALNPDIGGVIVDLYLDDDGRPARFQYEYVDYIPKDEDWDDTASKRAGRGWSIGEAVRV